MRPLEACSLVKSLQQKRSAIFQGSDKRVSTERRASCSTSDYLVSNGQTGANLISLLTFALAWILISHKLTLDPYPSVHCFSHICQVMIVCRTCRNLYSRNQISENVMYMSCNGHNT